MQDILINSVDTLIDNEKDIELKNIGTKILNEQRLTFAEGVALFEKGSLGFVGALANFVRKKKSKLDPKLFILLIVRVIHIF